MNIEGDHLDRFATSLPVTSPSLTRGAAAAARPTRHPVQMRYLPPFARTRIPVAFRPGTAATQTAGARQQGNGKTHGVILSIQMQAPQTPFGFVDARNTPCPEAPNVDQTDIDGLTDAVTGTLGIN
jgi:hypothetical protein